MKQAGSFLVTHSRAKPKKIAPIPPIMGPLLNKIENLVLKSSKSLFFFTFWTADFTIAFSCDVAKTEDSYESRIFHLWNCDFRSIFIVYCWNKLPRGDFNNFTRCHFRWQISAYLISRKKDKKLEQYIERSENQQKIREESLKSQWDLNSLKENLINIIEGHSAKILNFYS